MTPGAPSKSLGHRQTAPKANLVRRARLIAGVRAYFDAAGFLDVETPVRIPAPAPEANIDAQPSGDWYLHTSPELCMKRLLASGCEKIYQITHCFRRAERGRRHLPEMTLLEWYETGAVYTDLMTRCESLITAVAIRLGVGQTLRYAACEVDLTPPWDRLSVDAAYRRYAGISARQALVDGRFDEIMGLAIEPHLGRERPVFLHDYPADCGALARLKPGDPSVAERFELYIAGMELCNAFSELTDPVEQRSRFEAENRLRAAGGKPVYPIAEPFLEALAAMPPAAGNALGIDRLAMLFCNAAAIDDVVAFTPETL